MEKRHPDGLGGAMGMAEGMKKNIFIIDIYLLFINKYISKFGKSNPSSYEQSKIPMERKMVKSARFNADYYCHLVHFYRTLHSGRCSFIHFYLQPV